MKIFVGRIPSYFTNEDIDKYFSSFGSIRDLNVKNGYAFVEYDSDDVADHVLSIKDHRINDISIVVEQSTGKRKTRDDGYGDRRMNERQGQGPPRNDAYGYDYPPSPPPPSYDYHPPAPYSAYPERRPPYDYDRRPDVYNRDPYARNAPYGDLRRDPREDCPHCSRCEIHGNPRRRDDYYDPPKRMKPREYPNDVNKMVIQNIPSDISDEDVRGFVESLGFTVVYTRITQRRDAAIVELNNVESKEEAIRKISGLEFKDTVLSTRDFVSKGQSMRRDNYTERDDNNNYRSSATEQNVDIYSGIDTTNAD